MRLGRTIGRWMHEIVLALVLAGVAGVAAWLDPSFLAPATQLDLASHAAEVLLLSLPMTLIIISGGIDLSVGSTLALSSVVFGLVYRGGAGIPVAALGAVAAGGAAGALNGAFIARLRVHPLIVTLASLAAFRGLAEGISLGHPVSGFPDGFLRLGGGTVAGIPIPLMVCAGAAVTAGLVTWRTTLGFRVYAIGANERAARYGGIAVDRLKFVLYTVSGIVAGVAAVVLAARRNTAKADMGDGLELQVITAVVLGGASIYGGRGRITGTVLGVVLIHEVREFVSWQWDKDEVILIVTGGVLIGSVLMNNLLSRWRR